MENNIDDIFTRDIEPLESEPSEEFWRKAAEDVIARGNKAAETKLVRWKAVAFVLGAGLVLLSYFTYRIQNGLENVDKKIEAVQDMQNQSISKSKASSVSTSNNKNLAVNSTDNIPVAANQKQYTNRTAPAQVIKTIPAITAPAVNKTYKRAANAHVVAFGNRSTNRTAYHKHTELTGSKGNSAVAYNTPQSKVDVQSHVGNPINNATENNAAVTNSYPPIAQTGLKTDSVSQALASDDTASDVAGQTATLTSISDTARIILPKSFEPGDSISRLSVSVIFAPEYLINYKFRATDAWGTQSENAIKNGEKQNFSYSTGAVVDYKLSPRFSISAGIGYQVFSFSTQPGTIYDKKQSDGDVGYYMATSSGIINCSYAGYSRVGDSLRINTSSTRKYLDIPLQAKYFFLTATKVRMYFAMGTEVNFSVGENTVMNWQNFRTESGTENVTNPEGSRNMYFSYYLGMGISYKVANSLSFYIEPGLHEAVTPIDDNIDIITYPRLFSVLGGITYTVR